MINGVFFMSQLILIIFNELVFIDLTSFSFFWAGTGGGEGLPNKLSQDCR